MTPIARPGAAVRCKPLPWDELATDSTLDMTGSLKSAFIEHAVILGARRFGA
jgi:hypothetical protein